MKHAINRIFGHSSKGFLLFAVLLYIAFATYAGSVWAGGLYLQEFGTPSMGVASAGAEAVCRDASIAYRINEQWSVSGSVNLMYGKLELDAAIPLQYADLGDAKIRSYYTGDYDKNEAISLAFKLEVMGAGMRIVESAGLIPNVWDFTG